MVIEAEVGAMLEIAGLVTNTIPFYWLIILKCVFFVSDFLSDPTLRLMNCRLHIGWSC